MPIPKVDYIPRPYAGTRYTPDTSRLQSIYMRGGEDLARLALQRGESQANTLARLGSILSGTLEGVRGDKAAKAAMAQREREKAEERSYAAEQARLEREARKAERDTEREVRSAERGDQRFERDLEREIEGERRTAMQAFLEKFGGIVGPNGQAVLPPKAEPPPHGGRLVDPQTGKVVYTAPPKADASASDPDQVQAPTDPNTQDILSQAGLSYNAFQVLAGRMSQLPRDRATRERASKEVESWARKRGMDVSTLAAQYKASNEVLQSNIQRFNTVKNVEAELAGDVENVMKAAKDAGLNDVRAINAANLWLKGELNDAEAADYAFSLRALISDIARYNAASSGRAPLESDMADARATVRAGIASGSLKGLQSAINRSVANMGGVLEGSVNRAQKDVWNLFGVGDKYKPVSRRAPSGGGKADPLGIRK